MPKDVRRSIPLDRIESVLRNPRRKLGGIEELAQSIDAYGLLQPIVVRPRSDGRFDLVAGHRRKEARRVRAVAEEDGAAQCQLAGLQRLAADR